MKWEHFVLGTFCPRNIFSWEHLVQEPLVWVYFVLGTFSLGTYSPGTFSPRIAKTIVDQLPPVALVLFLDLFAYVQLPKEIATSL
jgi:hypothetical protein